MYDTHEENKWSSKNKTATMMMEKERLSYIVKRSNNSSQDTSPVRLINVPKDKFRGKEMHLFPDPDQGFETNSYLTDNTHSDDQRHRILYMTTSNPLHLKSLLYRKTSTQLLYIARGNTRLQGRFRRQNHYGTQFQEQGDISKKLQLSQRCNTWKEDLPMTTGLYSVSFFSVMRWFSASSSLSTFVTYSRITWQEQSACHQSVLLTREGGGQVVILACRLAQWGQRLEKRPNMEARLAGWRKMTPAGRDLLVMVPLGQTQSC